MESKPSALRQTIEKYCVLHGWHKLNFAFSRDMTRLGLSAMKVSVTTSGLPHRNLNQIPFFPGKQSLRIIAPTTEKPYVTVHHGFDLLFLPARTEEYRLYARQRIFRRRNGGKLSRLLLKEGVDVIQLGIAEEEKIRRSHPLLKWTDLS